VALIAAISVLWVVDRNYTPVLVAAIRKMPDEAIIRNGRLEGVSTGLLAERKFLSVAIDLGDRGGVGQIADLQLELHKRNVWICPSYRSLAGVILFRYPASGSRPVSRANLEPWWDAWKPMCYVGILMAVGLGLLVIWTVLAAIYTPVIRVIAYFGDRSLRLGQCWNLAGAALMPGALLMVLAIVLYGSQVIDLIGLIVLSAFHFVLGWVYVSVAPLSAPRLARETAVVNPFDS
jgi:hypothetical protein